MVTLGNEKSPAISTRRRPEVAHRIGGGGGGGRGRRRRPEEVDHRIGVKCETERQTDLQNCYAPIKNTANNGVVD